MTTTVPALDPDSDVAHAFIETLADIQLAIDARKRAAAMRTEQAAEEPVRLKAA